jgi:hypothetical protein
MVSSFAAGGSFSRQASARTGPLPGRPDPAGVAGAQPGRAALRTDRYSMNGTTIQSSVTITVGDPSWHAIGTGVFNGVTEIASQNNNGAPGIWLMNGTTPSAEVALSNPGAGWQLVAMDHFTPDGKAGLLFQNTGGPMMLWEMNGTSVAAMVNLQTPDPGWQSVNGHPFATG